MRPSKLYKYQPFSRHAIDNLASGNIFFSRLKIDSILQLIEAKRVE